MTLTVARNENKTWEALVHGFELRGNEFLLVCFGVSVIDLSREFYDISPKVKIAQVELFVVRRIWHVFCLQVVKPLRVDFPDPWDVNAERLSDDASRVFNF